MLAAFNDEVFVKPGPGGTRETVIGCENCTPVTQKKYFCPSSPTDPEAPPLTDPAPKGRKFWCLPPAPKARPGMDRVGGTEFDSCPAYYRRHPSRYPGLPFSVGIQHPFEIVSQVDYEVEKGTLSLSELPGKLYDLVLYKRGLDAQKMRREMDERDMARKNPQSPGPPRGRM